MGGILAFLLLVAFVLRASGLVGFPWAWLIVPTVTWLALSVFLFFRNPKTDGSLLKSIERYKEARINYKNSKNERK